MGSTAPGWLMLFLASSLCAVTPQRVAGTDPAGGLGILQGKPPRPMGWSALSGWGYAISGDNQIPQGCAMPCHAAPSMTRS